jgi:hypothetical protein
MSTSVMSTSVMSTSVMSTSVNALLYQHNAVYCLLFTFQGASSQPEDCEFRGPAAD